MRHRKARPQGQRRRPPLSEIRACGPKDVMEQAIAAYRAGLPEHENCVLCGRAEPELIGIFFVPDGPEGYIVVTYGICEACKALPESFDKAEAAVVSQIEADIAAGVRPSDH